MTNATDTIQIVLWAKGTPKEGQPVTQAEAKSAGWNIYAPDFFVVQGSADELREKAEDLLSQGGPFRNTVAEAIHYELEAAGLNGVEALYDSEGTVGESDFENAAEKLANMSAAEAWSTPTDAAIDQYGEDIFVIAEFGDALAVNGGIVDDATPPKTHKVTKLGGHVPTTEEEVPLKFIIAEVAAAKDIDRGYVAAIARRIYGEKESIFSSASGSVEIYMRRKR